MQFNECLILFRKQRGLTQDELAEKLDVSRQSVSKWELGECYPDASKLMQLADVLDVGMDALCGRTTPEQGATLPPVQPTPKKRTAFWVAAVALAVVLMALSACGGYFLAVGTHKTAEVLPQRLDVQLVSIDREGGGLTCTFVPSAMTEHTTYTLTLTGTMRNYTTSDVRYQNGVCIAHFSEFPDQADSLSVTASLFGAERSMVIATDLRFYDRSLEYVRVN